MFQAQDWGREFNLILVQSGLKRIFGPLNSNQNCIWTLVRNISSNPSSLSGKKYLSLTIWNLSRRQFNNPYFLSTLLSEIRMDLRFA